MVLFIIGHWWKGLLLQRPAQVKSGPAKVPLAVYRSVRRLMITKVPGFTSTGHGALVLIVLAINVVLLFVHLDCSSMEKVGQRLGWHVVPDPPVAP